MELITELIGMALMLVGVAGSVLPILPGAPLVFLGALLIAWARNFSLIGWPILTTLALLAVLTLVVDFIASVLGAKRSGASKLALVGATCGAIIGLFAGIIGIILGPFLGAIIGELMVRQDLKHAWNVGVGAWIGLFLGSAVKAGLTLAMLTLTIFAYFF